MNSVQISGSEYEKQYVPFGGFLLIAKDMEHQKIGSIHLTDNIRDTHSKFTTTGVVIAKSMFKRFENEYDEYIFGLIRKGDRIGYSGTVPLNSPSPPAYQFQGDDVQKYVTIHMRDVLGWICETEEKKIELAERFL